MAVRWPGKGAGAAHTGLEYDPSHRTTDLGHGVEQHQRLRQVNISVKTANFTTNSTDAVESFSDAGSSSSQTTAMRFNADATMPGSGFWIYNLDTKGLTINTNYEIRPKVGTSSQVTSNFALLRPTK